MDSVKGKPGWRRKYRPAGGWQLLLGVLLSFTLLGMAGAVAYYYASAPAAIRVITPPTPKASTLPPVVIRAPTPRASTRYVTRTPPPQIVITTAPQPAAVPDPAPTRAPPSTGQANIPGVSGWQPSVPSSSSSTQGVTPPDTQNPSPGVTPPASPSSPSQGGF